MVLFNWQEKIVDEELQQVKDVLDNDGLIIFPTDTVYGIACNCFSNIAIEKVFLAKKRQREKPINVLLNNKEKISLVANKITSKERTLIEKYMPGDLTIILEKKKQSQIF